MFVNMKLRRLLFLGFTILSVVPVLFLGAWVERSALQTELEAVADRHLLVARNLTAALSRYVQDTEAVFRLVAVNTAADRPVRGISSLLASLHFKHVCIVDEQGRVERFVSTVDGLQLRQIPASVLSRVRTALPSTGVAFTDLIADRNGSPTIYMGESLGNGRLALGALSTDYLVKMQKSITFGQGGHAAIVDRLGQVMAHPNDDWRKSMNDLSQVEPVVQMIAGITGSSTFFSPAAQQDMISGFTTVPGVGWGVMISQPLAELHDRAKGVQGLALRVILLGIVVAGMMSWWLAGYLARPVQAVAAAARDIANDRLDVRVGELPRFVPTELRGLAVSFNTMVDKLGLKNTELVNKSEILRTTLDNMEEGITLLDRDLKIVLFNQRFLDLFNLSADHLKPGTPVEDFVRYLAERGEFGPGKVDDLVRVRVERTRSFSPYHIEHVRPDNTVLEIRRNPVSSGGLVTTYTDITERKRAEEDLHHASLELEVRVQDRTTDLSQANALLRREVEERKRVEKALRASEARFKDFAETAADWYWETGPDLRFTYLAGNYPDVMERAAVQVLGLNHSELYGEQSQDPQKWKRHLEDLEARRPFEAFEQLWIRPDGTTRVLRVSGKPFSDGKGNFKGYRGAGSDVTESHNMAQQMAHQATHDALTGLINRSEFEHRLQRVLTTSRTEEVQHALCYLDLDQFKVINDTCGHLAGDELLRQLGGILQERIRKRDSLARLGGDEFGILMEHCSLDEAQRVATAVRRAIEDFRFLWENKSFNVGVSIGLVPVTEHSKSITDVLSAADAACYAAKDSGRNRVHVHREDDEELARRHGEMQWVSRIHRALEEKRFKLEFQPIVPINSTINGQGHYELLIRMQDDDRMVPPGAFLPAAERYHLATKLDRWVICNACDWLAQHPEHLDRLHLCSINLSGHSLGDEEFLMFVAREMEQAKIPPSKICFEITETAAIANLSSATRFIKALKLQGCRFALDDFGSGFSSFAYLKNLPVDFLKIDGVFVKDIVEDPIDYAMVKSINEIGQVMGKQTIAEFVENTDILEKLREIGVDYAQGYGIGMPRPMEAMA